MTILEFARAHGYTKNAVKCQFKKLSADDYYKDSSGTIHLNESGSAKLVELMEKNRQNHQKTDFEPVQETKQEPPETTAIIEMLQQQVQELQRDKEFLQEQLQQASNRADFLTIQTLPFFKRRKALKDYNQRMLLSQKQED